MTKGLIIPVRPDGSSFAATASASASASAGLGDIAALWKSSNAKPRPGETRIFYGQGSDRATVLALVGVGKTDKLSENECVSPCLGMEGGQTWLNGGHLWQLLPFSHRLKERSRIVAAAGVKALRDVGCTEVRPSFVSRVQSVPDRYRVLIA